MAGEGNPKCFGHEARGLTFAWCSVVYTNKQLDDSDVEATMTCSREGTDVAEAGFWESSDNTLHTKLFSENFLENIQIFIISLYLYLGLNVQEVRGQFFFYVTTLK